jgi:hypothetical protein
MDASVVGWVAVSAYVRDDLDAKYGFRPPEQRNLVGDNWPLLAVLGRTKRVSTLLFVSWHPSIRL